MKVHTEINNIITINTIKLFQMIVISKAMVTKYIYIYRTLMRFYTRDKSNECNNFDKCTNIIKNFFFYYISIFFVHV